MSYKDRKEVDECLNARWVIPVVPRSVYFENYSVVIDKGKILDLLPIKEVQKKYNPHCVHDFDENHVLIPGLINMHAHSAMTLLRGFADDVTLQSWLNDYIWPAERQFLDEEFVEDGSKLAIAEMIRCGTTCFNDMYFFSDVTAKAASRAGIRCAIGIPVMKFPSKWAGGNLSEGQLPSDDYVKKGLSAIYEPFKDDPLVNITMAPHAAYTVSDHGFDLINKAAETKDLKVHCHIHETKADVEQHMKDNDGLTSLQRLEKLGVVNKRLIAVHMTQLTDTDIAMLAKSGSSVVHCPESNMKLASGICPVAKLLKAGVNVCIGTDSAASNDDLDLLGEVRTAALLDKIAAKDATCVPAWQMLEMATINGAKALGLEKEIGSLEIGKYADITAIKLRTEPVYNPITNLVYVGTNDVTDVWVNGKHLLKRQVLVTLNEASLLRKARAWGIKIREWKEQQTVAEEQVEK